MQFENPLILYFLLFLIVPIIIHLFNLRRYKKVFFSNLFLLKTIKQESKKKRELKKWLILLSRLLLISVLILAFSKPYIKTKNISEKSKSISIYIDNSLSMDLISDKNKKLIEEAKHIALEIIKNLDKEQKINIITNDYSYNNQKFQTKEKAIEIIEKIEVSPFNTNICDVLERQSSLKDEKDLVYKFIISDFDKKFINNTGCNITDLPNLETISLKGFNERNISINNCKFENSFHKKGQTEKIIVELENYGKEKQDSIQFRLYINEKQRGIFSVSIPPESIVQKHIDIINTESGPVSGKLELINDDDFNFDNTLFFSYEIKEKINVLCISEENITQELWMVFNDPTFELKQFNKDQIKISEIQNYDLIILDHLISIPSGLTFDLTRSLEKENNILIFPAKNLNFESYNNFLQSHNIDRIKKWSEKEIKTKFINLNHWVFNNVFEIKSKDIDLPIINGYFKIENNNSNYPKNTILKLLNDDLFFGEYQRKSGKIFLCTSPINVDYTNFSKHAIFLPIMHNICRNENAKDLYYQIVKNIEIKSSNIFSNGDIPIIKYVVEEIEKNSFFPDLKIEKNHNYLKLKNNILKSGNYELFTQNKSEINFKKYLSFNYDRIEGDFNLNTNYTKNLLNLGLELNTFDKNHIIEKKPIDITFYLIIIGIFLFLIELLLVKFWKK